MHGGGLWYQFTGIPRHPTPPLLELRSGRSSSHLLAR